MSSRRRTGCTEGCGSARLRSIRCWLWRRWWISPTGRTSARWSPRGPLTINFVFARLTVMEVLAVGEAAKRLGVSTRQVQHLAARGELHLVARGLVDRTSIDRHLATRQGSRRRAWSENTAWGAVAVLSGQQAPWMGVSQRSRLKQHLRHLTATGVVGRARNRAQALCYEGHPQAANRLRHDIVDTSDAAQALGLADADRVDGYVAAENLRTIVTRHALVETPDGQYILRATTMDLSVVRALADSSLVLAALDLAESLDVRERRAGLDALSIALRWLA